MVSIGKPIRIGVASATIYILIMVALAVMLMWGTRLDLKKHLPVPELSDKEVRGLLEALRLPDTTKFSAMRVVYLEDGVDIGISVRARIDQSQLDEVVRASWMESHQVAASKFNESRMMLPPMYAIDWWELFPLQMGDKRFYLPLEQPQQSYPGSITAVVRKVGPNVDLYFLRSSHSDYLPPIVLEAMQRGRSPDMGLPSQGYMYEVKKGKF